MTAYQSNLQYEIINEILIIKLIGELSFDNSYQLEELFETKLDKFSCIIFDFVDVSFIGSFALGIIYNMSRDKNVTIVTGENSISESSLRFLNFDKIVNVCKTRLEALESLGNYNE